MKKPISKEAIERRAKKLHIDIPEEQKDLWIQMQMIMLHRADMVEAEELLETVEKLAENHHKIKSEEELAQDAISYIMGGAYAEAEYILSELDRIVPSETGYYIDEEMGCVEPIKPINGYRDIMQFLED